MTGILKWLGQQMQAGNSAPREECELRLESDEKAVRIITVHKSKGLEFDVVFCPYVWSEAKTRAGLSRSGGKLSAHSRSLGQRGAQTAAGKKKRSPRSCGSFTSR